MNKTFDMQADTKIPGVHNRFKKPLDRLWLSGIVTVNVLVWTAFGMQYIGLALIAYCFVFMLAMRRRINAAYPAESGVEYHIGYEFNWPGWSFEKSFWKGLLFIMVSVILAFICLVVVSVNDADVAAQSLVFLSCNGFLLSRYRALFTACCGRGTLAKTSETRVQRMLGARRNGAFSRFRLILATVAFALAWGGLLVAYATEWLGGNSLFGFDLQYMTETGNLFGLITLPAGIVIVPAFLHLIFFETSTTVLRGWGDKP